MRHEIVPSFEEGSVEWMAGVDIPPTLTAFLLARIAEDEAVACAATSGPWEEGERIVSAPEGAVVDDGIDGEAGCVDPADAEHIARFDPARMLAECEAKRCIVEEARVSPHELADSQDWGAFKEAEDICGMLAAVYADHPDFNEAWRA